jgi:hypothetical protein
VTWNAGACSSADRLVRQSGAFYWARTLLGRLPRGARPWYWEGNVQAAVVSFLAGDRWFIRRVASTESREHGKDIEAERDGVTLWATVKGFPEHANPSTQARLWFESAVFDVILWRQEYRSVRIIVALPKRPTYQNLANRTTWFQQAADFSYLWVAEDGVEQS